MNIYKHRKIPDEMDLIFIGDLHGDYYHFEKRLKENNINKDNTFIVSTGDIIDRGPNIKKCCDEFLNNPNFDMVIGNHEMFMFNRYNMNFFHPWVANGGQETINQLDFEGVDLISKQMLEEFSIILEIEHRGKTFGIIHAEITEDYKIFDWNDIIKTAKKNEEFSIDLMCSRKTISKIIKEEHNTQKINGIDFVIHGHTGISKPLLSNNRLWIDTLFRGGQLTLAQLDYSNHQWNFL